MAVQLQRTSEAAVSAQASGVRRAAQGSTVAQTAAGQSASVGQATTVQAHAAPAA